MRFPRMLWAGLVTWAATGTLALSVLAAPATAATRAPLNVDQGEQTVSPWAFGPPDSYWVHSITAGNWYQTSNGNQGFINPTGSGTWQLIKDDDNGKCLTFIPAGKQANEIVDATCNASNPAQSWQSAAISHFSDTTWYFWNKWEVTNETCPGNHPAFITGDSAIGTLFVKCPEGSNGAPSDNQQFVLAHQA